MRRGMGRTVGGLAVAACVCAQGAAAVQAAPAVATLRVDAEQVARDGATLVALTGQRWVVRGTVRPYVPGQRVVVRLYRHGRKVLVRRVAIQRVHGTKVGRFRLGVASGRAGAVTIRATHRATEAQRTLVANPKRVTVLDARALGGGARGPLVRVLQRRLAALAYAVPSSGVFDDGTARAVIAYRKVNGLPRVGVADRALVERVLRGAGAFRLRHPDHGRHVEADLSRQVIALADAGKVVRVYPTSSGAPGTPTVRGSFHFYLKTRGTNAKGMVDANYFIGGYAIHGYHSVPVFNASHGCLRVPIPNASAIFAWVRVGDRIDVYP